jgi:phosphoribosylformimino-5-aminoimidazole carboxamide ribotide isomerase
MIAIPAIDIMSGECVQLVGGQQGTEKRFGDPLGWASRFISAGAKRIHIIDLDSAFGMPVPGSERVPLQLAQDIKFKWPDVKVQIGGGLRSTETVENALKYADQVIVGTRAMNDQQWLEEISTSHPGRMIVAVDVREGKVLTHAWTKGSDLTARELAKRITPAGVRSVLYTNVDIEGRLTGITPRIVREALESLPDLDLIWAGGIASIRDIGILRDEKVFGCVLGSCLYFNKVDLREALRIGVG